MKEYVKPFIEDEEILIEDICSNASNPTQKDDYDLDGDFDDTL